MISVCTTCINSKFETDLFVQALLFHNAGFDFEICLMVDDRVEDGSFDHFRKLSETHLNLKVFRSTFEDSVNYIEGMVTRYRKWGKFSPRFVEFLEKNLDRYKEGTLFSKTKGFLWLPPAWLYNRAVARASGDLFVITPADYVYLFRLADLEKQMKKRTVSDIGYCKLWGLRRPISNRPKEDVKEALRGSRGKTTFPGAPAFRDFSRYPSKPKDCCIPDPFTGEILWLTDPSFFQKVAAVCSAVPDLAIHHGLHCLTRKTFEKIGGFSEEFYGRAFAEDKMAWHGIEVSRAAGIDWKLPKPFSVAWSSRSQIPSSLTSERLREIDPYSDRHPVHGSPQVYLDARLARDAPEIIPELPDHFYDKRHGRALPNAVFGTRTPVVRVFGR